MKTILCPINRTSTARNAFAYATLLSEETQSDLLTEEQPLMDNLFRNYQRLFPLTQPFSGSRTGKMNSAKDLHQAAYPDPTRQVQTVYSLAWKAVSEKAELLVVGVENDFGLGDMNSESIVNLIKQAKCPALFIPQEVAFKPFEKILVIMNQEMNIDHRFSVIVDLALPFGAEIIFLQITPAQTLTVGSPFLESMKEMYLSFPYPHTSFHTIQHETLTEGITRFAEQVKADLIAIVPNLQARLPYSYTANLANEQLTTTSLTIPLLAIDCQPLTTSRSVKTIDRQGQDDETQQLDLYKKHI
ncbi:hypothetical protein [Rhodocytophaga aerolata]|nr:hypothetical protein [Rhodocytophaga aerolata]